jgi:hypothetical protein
MGTRMLNSVAEFVGNQRFRRFKLIRLRASGARLHWFAQQVAGGHVKGAFQPIELGGFYFAANLPLNNSIAQSGQFFPRFPLTQART